MFLRVHAKRNGVIWCRIARTTRSPIFGCLHKYRGCPLLYPNNLNSWKNLEYSCDHVEKRSEQIGADLTEIQWN